MMGVSRIFEKTRMTPGAEPLMTEQLVLPISLHVHVTCWKNFIYNAATGQYQFPPLSASKLPINIEHFPVSRACRDMSDAINSKFH